MFDLLVDAQARNNDAPTHEHSYMTIRSLGALKFAILSLLEYTGVVFSGRPPLKIIFTLPADLPSPPSDNSFHQKGIASDPASAVPGYILGGLSWFAMVS